MPTFATALDPSEASPGFLGFVTFFVLAIALWLLVRNMTKRLRRMQYQEAQDQRQLADEAEKDEAGVDEASKGAVGEDQVAQTPEKPTP